MYSEAQRRAHILTCRPSCCRIQLDQAHVHPLVPDGIFGPETAAAVRDFQRRNGLLVTGTAGYETWTAIYQLICSCSSATLPAAVSFSPAGSDGQLAAGDKGPSVLVLQLLLSRRCPIFPP